MDLDFLISPSILIRLDCHGGGVTSACHPSMRRDGGVQNIAEQLLRSRSRHNIEVAQLSPRRGNDLAPPAVIEAPRLGLNH